MREAGKGRLEEVRVSIGHLIIRFALNSEYVDSGRNPS